MLDVEVIVLPATTDVMVFFGPVAGPWPMFDFEFEKPAKGCGNSMCIVADDDDDDSGEADGDGVS